MRPGGNPELKQHQFIASGDEPLEKFLGVRISAGMMEKLKRKPNYAEYVRQAIARALHEDGE